MPQSIRFLGTRPGGMIAGVVSLSSGVSRPLIGGRGRVHGDGAFAGAATWRHPEDHLQDAVFDSFFVAAAVSRDVYARHLDPFCRASLWKSVS